MTKSDNHEAAQTAWDADGKRSPTSGLGERVRGSNQPRIKNPDWLAYRQSTRNAFRNRQAADVKRAKRTEPYPKDESRYFPHQGPRECARRLRQGIVL